MTTALLVRSCARIWTSASPPLAILIADVQAATCESDAEPCSSAIAAAAAQTWPAFPPEVPAKLEPAASNDAVATSTPNFSDMRASRYLVGAFLSFSYAHTNPRRKEHLHNV
jgi:hypothetical protein